MTEGIMKRTVLMILSVLMSAALAACSNNAPGGTVSQTAPATQTTATQTTAVASQTPQTSATPEPTQDMSYAFELEDLGGKMHKLSDYEGKPVYLEIWGSWCGVCVSSLPEMDEFAGQDHDFTVLSVVTPGVSGEMSKEDFIEWYKGQGYKNLIVLLDENAQIVNDFGVSAYPSQIMFDSEGNVVVGFAGLMPKDTIVDIMGQIAAGTYER